MAPLLFECFLTTILIESVGESAKIDEVTADIVKIKRESRENRETTMAETAEPHWGMVLLDKAGIVSRSSESLKGIMLPSCALLVCPH